MTIRLSRQHASRHLLTPSPILETEEHIVKKTVWTRVLTGGRKAVASSNWKHHVTHPGQAVKLMIPGHASKLGKDSSGFNLSYYRKSFFLLDMQTQFNLYYAGLAPKMTKREVEKLRSSVRQISRQYKPESVMYDAHVSPSGYEAPLKDVVAEANAAKRRAAAAAANKKKNQAAATATANPDALPSFPTPTNYSKVQVQPRPTQQQRPQPQPSQNRPSAGQPPQRLPAHQIPTSQPQRQPQNPSYPASQPQSQVQYSYLPQPQLEPYPQPQSQPQPQPYRQTQRQPQLQPYRQAQSQNQRVNQIVYQQQQNGRVPVQVRVPVQLQPPGLQGQGQGYQVSSGGGGGVYAQMQQRKTQGQFQGQGGARQSVLVLRGGVPPGMGDDGGSSRW